jgi:hypothetical protein
LLRGTLTEGRMTLDDGPVLALGDEMSAVRELVATPEATLVGASNGFWLVDQAEARFVDAPGDGDVKALYVADLDADGADDLVVRSDTQAIEGSFSRHVARIATWRRSEHGYERALGFDTAPNEELFALGDLDGDGASDLVSFLGAEVIVHLNDRNFDFADTFEGPSLPDAVVDSVPLGGSLYDADGDGMRDVVAIYSGQGAGIPEIFAAVFSGDGEGGLAATTRTILRQRWDGSISLAGFGDVSGDGVPDAVLLLQESSDTSGVYVAEGRSGGSFGDLRHVFTSAGVINAQLVDPDDDGTNDVACLHSAGPNYATLSVLHSLAAPQLELEHHEIPIGDVHAVAVRSDGTLDVLVAFGCEPACDGACAGRCVMDVCLSCVDDRDCSEGVCRGSLHTCTK